MLYNIKKIFKFVVEVIEKYRKKNSKSIDYFFKLINMIII